MRTREAGRPSGPGEAQALCVALAQMDETLASLRLCTEETQRQMEHSLARMGQLSSVLLNRVGASFEVVDGFKRLKAARALGWRELRAEVMETDGAASKLRMWESNRGCGVSELEEAWLVRALYRQEELTQPRIAQLLGRHKSWVSRRLMLAEGLSDGIQADVRLGLLSATAARELGQLPRGNQDAAAQVVSRRGLTTRQTVRLVRELSDAVDDTVRGQVLADAMQWAGGVEKSRGGKPAARTPGEWLISDAAAVAKLSARLHARLLERSLASLGESAAAVASRTLHGLRPGLLSLCGTIERVVGARGVGDVRLS